MANRSNRGFSSVDDTSLEKINMEETNDEIKGEGGDYYWCR